MPNGPLMLTIGMSSSDARSFLRKLAEDDSFRRRLRANPHATLARANIVLPSELVPERLHHLPSKQFFREFMRTGYPSAPDGGKPDPPVFGPCLMWSVLYAIASQAKPAQRA